MKWDLTKLKAIFDKKTPGKLPVAYIVIMLVVGVLLLVAGSLNRTSSTLEVPDSPEEQEVSQQVLSDTPEGNALPASGKSADAKSVVKELEAAYEDELKTAIQEMMGVEDATVMVTLESAGERVFERNETSRQQTTNEEDPNGGKRTINETTTEENVVILRQGDKETAVLKKTATPEVRGVLVVAEGADNIQVKSWIIEAVTKSLGVPPHRVSVLPKKKEER
ncbi:stage III sporulation protein AG [Aureibacillus halotolerans]|uniref:Stage III sporulation protein AG n=1 Tax=Aureibacillus halotolerans TaxID=1508390 RepID=A0A4R6U5A3_9BACI|nr:stage III sporulation protein AG [Aureibacillus halotolerans]TDQ41650.1 stage III sporulation protein AG [Aureibacillus halotolerans]